MGHGEFLWCDLATFDVARSLEFYKSVFGWSFEAETTADNVPYYCARSGGELCGAIYEMPQEFRDQGMESFWMSYISIEDIDQGVARATALGGSLKFGPAVIGSNNAIAMIQDPNGGVFSLFKGEYLEPLPRMPRPGHQFWNELVTSDERVSAAFYNGLFGWRVAVPDEKGLCAITNLAGAEIGALYQPAVDPPQNAHWDVTFACEGPKTAARAIKAAGGTILPHRGYGRGSIYAADPDGARFCVSGTRPGKWFGGSG